MRLFRSKTRAELGYVYRRGEESEEEEKSGQNSATRRKERMTPDEKVRAKHVSREIVLKLSDNS